jgi:hypothetical protein
MPEVAAELSEELTLEQMEAVLYLHEKAERSGDLETIMSTVSGDPHYELVSVGWKVDGWDAVEEMYRRMNITGPNITATSTKRVHALAPNTLIREASVYFDHDGKRTVGQYAVVLSFSGGKIAGERMYLDPVFAAGLAHVLGDDFGDVPGVSRL